MKFFSFLSGKSKVVDDVFDKDSGLLAKFGGWVGNSKFTAEEQAEMLAETTTSVQKFVVATLSENTDRSKARREIAKFWMKFYAILIFMTGITYPIDPSWSSVWFSLVTNPGVAALVGGIGLFFYGSYGLARHNETKGNNS